MDRSSDVYPRPVSRRPESILGSLRITQRGMIAIVMLAIGAAARIFLILQPLPEMMRLNLPDDAFYYLVIARNAARGLGLSFDGIHPTNGFHPLWALALIPVYTLASNPVASLRLVLAAGLVMDLAAALLYSRLAERIVPRSGLLVLALYLLNPQLILESANGLETSLAMVTLACFLHAALLFARNDRARNSYLLGVSAGLVFLARTDLSIVVILVSGLLLWWQIRSHRARTRVLKPLLLAGMAAALLVTPWLLWSAIRVGSVVQSSAVAIPRLAAHRVQFGGDLWGGFYFPVLNYSLRMAIIYPGIGWLVLAAAILLPRSLSRLFLDPEGEPPDRGSQYSRGIVLLWAALAGTLVILAIHTFVRWYPRGWYFTPLAGMVALLAGVQATRRPLRLGTVYLAAAIVASAMLLFAQGWRKIQEQVYPGQAAWVVAGEWLQANTPSGTVIGAFNAGILAYFSERTVVNLDGVVDWEAIRAREREGLLDYLRQRGGSYLLDRQAYIWESFGPFLGPGAQDLLQLHAFEGPDVVYGPLTLYRVGGDR